MEPLPRGSYYDPSDYYDPSNYWLGMYEVEMRSESVQGTAPEAEGGRIHEGNPGFVGDINHESVNNEGDINLEDNINLEGDINLDGDINLESNINLEGDINLESNINLEGDINLDGDINLESDINMDGGDINLDGDINLEGIDFEGIDFESDINFEGFNFEDDINFEGIDFEGINFEGINFESDINFEGINFESDINFEGDVNYEGNINREVVVNHEGEGNHEVASGVQELGQQQPEELPQVAAAEAPQPRSRQRGVQRNKFTPMQVRELESVFQHTQYPDALMRRELARRMNVTEIRVQVWFKNKRAKCRRDERASMLRNAPPANLDHIFVFMLDGSNMPSRSEARLEMGSFGATDTLPRLPPL